MVNIVGVRSCLLRTQPLNHAHGNGVPWAHVVRSFLLRAHLPAAPLLQRSDELFM
jgi:hypothetical protein